MIRLIHVGDVHLGAGLGGFGKLAGERQEQVLAAFRRLPEIVTERSADALLIAGDLFDGPRPAESLIAAVRDTVRRIEESGARAFAVPGNHDAVSLNPGLYTDAIGEGAFLEASFGDPVTVRCGHDTLHVYGFAYDPAEESDPLSGFRRRDAEGSHVALLHGAVPGAPHWTGGHSLRLPAEALATIDADYIALGDYHRFRPPAEFEDRTPACYSGSFAAVDSSEIGPRGYVEVELEHGEPPRVTLHPSGAPEIVRIEAFDVTQYADETQVAEAIAQDIDDPALPIVSLTGEPGFPLDADRVQARLEARCGFAVVRDDTRFFDSARLVELAGEKTIAGHVARLGLERLEAAADEQDRVIAARGLRVALRAMGVR